MTAFHPIAPAPHEAPDDAPDDASARQRRAADPRGSAWLSANAGSGKTRVLTDRVARLLLAGEDPARILCLTYTKAAAAEMQTRLFKRLGGWSMREDGALIGELRALGLTEGLEPLDLLDARRLFAKALEVPGGLKIQTIHAFCASLLRRFPLEAGVPPQFRELDDAGAALLRAEVAEAMAGGEHAALVDRVARHAGAASFDKLLAMVAGKRDAFWPPAGEDELRALLGLAPDACEESLVAFLEAAETRALLRDAVALLAGGGAGDQDAAAAILALLKAPRLDAASLAALEEVLLYKGGEKAFTARCDRLPTKALRHKAPALVERLHALMREVEAARDRRLALAAHERNRDFHAFASAFVAAYQARKLARGALDFDDLIARARGLLTDPAVAQWVLWRLDGGIDHILVDEAQDTSPAQWAVIERLADEFSAGEGAEPRRRRTLFVVGDRKQSIFSFQGADAAGFDRMREHFGERLGRVGQRLEAGELLHSFRSAAAVLKAVDATFRAAPEGLGDAAPEHRAFHEEKPGRVDLWPPVLVEERPKAERPWTDPQDGTEPRGPEAELAIRVADAARAMVDGGSLPVRTGDGWRRRPVAPGDIMVLVRTRGPLFGAVIRELKRRGLPVAGADRLKLRAELAVRDVEAALRVLALPADSLSLACALKSPLFGWTEAQLYRLAQPRPPGQTLWEALREGEPCEALAILEDLRARVDVLRPYELASRLLVRHGGRERLVARLGPEAEDGLDAFLHQALAYEADAVPTLTGFLEWRGGADVEVKRQMEGAGGRIRVMTVHGAKGLESPVVILPDCAAAKRDREPEPLYAVAGRRAALWATARAEMPQAMLGARRALMEAEAREERRLLYVAMTRAESWLVVAAAGPCGGAADSWHGAVKAGLEGLGDGGRDGGRDGRWTLLPHAHPTGEGLRWGDGWDHLPPLGADAAAERPAPEPLPALGPVPPPGRRAATLSPSDLGGAKAIDAEDAERAQARALARGRLMHLALEHLPAAPPHAVLALLDGTEDATVAGNAPEIVEDAARLVADPRLAHLWGPEALAEAALSADVPPFGRLHGVVDRLVVTEGEVLVVDFKTNRAVPARSEDAPEGILRQMGAYLAMLRALYPGRRARAAVLWTREARLDELPGDLVMAALRRAGVPAA